MLGVRGGVSYIRPLLAAGAYFQKEERSWQEMSQWGEGSSPSNL